VRRSPSPPGPESDADNTPGSRCERCGEIHPKDATDLLERLAAEQPSCFCGDCCGFAAPAGVEILETWIARTTQMLEMLRFIAALPSHTRSELGALGKRLAESDHGR
jgi:hypothetical protein